ncbi:MAG: hypothetical protein RLZZ241_516 [Bacteroidota bacterium]
MSRAACQGKAETKILRGRIIFDPFFLKLYFELKMCNQES